MNNTTASNFKRAAQHCNGAVKHRTPSKPTTEGYSHE